MSNKTAIFRTLLAVFIAVGAVAIVLGGGRAYSQGAQSGIQERIVGDRVLSRVQIINLNDTIARVDTATGEVHLFSGDTRSPSSRGQWRLFASGVGPTSGYLEIQQPRGVEAHGVMFLVDIVTGDTWVFNRRSGRATWDRVDVSRR